MLLTAGLTGLAGAGLAGAGLAGVGLAVLSGSATAQQATPAPNPASPPAAGARQARALLVPRQEATLSSGFNGRIVRLPVDVGGRFKQGDLLVGFDCRSQQAQLARARAQYTYALAAHRSKKRLVRLQSASRLDAELAAAEAAKAKAVLAEAQVAVSRCTIRAPFDGRLARRHVNPFEAVSIGKPLLDILDDRALRVRVIVPSRWLRWLRPGSRFTLLIDETGKTYDAQVTLLGARIDPASQSIEVLGEFSKPVPGLLAGMSGRARFARP